MVNAGMDLESRRSTNGGSRRGMEVELPGGRRGLDGGASTEISVRGGGPPAGCREISMVRLVFTCMVAGGIQYGWALQLSLLTPYVQTLGISHTLSSLMWLCGPIAGFLVQPGVGFWSDKCRSKFGRRRPFILTGCVLICTAVIIIGFSSDIGYALGDTKEHCSLYHGPRWKAAIVFVAGFWVLDFSNNAVQGPARALMADLSGQHGMNAANAIFCSWMAFGNILGYASGASGGWHRWFPFLQTKACCEACANLKGAFLIAVVLLIFCMIVTLIVGKEVPFQGPELEQSNIDGIESDEAQSSVFVNIFKTFRNLPTGMPSVLLVTGLTWLSWFPFILYDTDWMGREVFHGNPKGTKAEIDSYDKGVRFGALGLLLNSAVLGLTSFLIEPLCRKLTARIVWITSNFMVFIIMAFIAIASVWSMKGYHGDVQVGADSHVKAVGLFLFAVLGFPMAVLYSVPFGFTAQLAANKGGGQGLCTGVLNISIVIPQVIVALGAGPWDAMFKKGNMSAFALASSIAFVCGFVGIVMLPRLSKSAFKSTGFGGH